MKDGAEALRRKFDASFAAPAAPREGATVSLLTVRAGGARLAVRTAQAAGLAPAGRLCAVPGARPELLGLAGLRGEILPVYGLARLLGWSDAGERPAWLLLAADPRQPGARIALACGDFEGQVVVPAGALARAEAAAAVPEVATLDGHAVPVADLPALLHLVHA